MEGFRIAKVITGESLQYTKRSGKFREQVEIQSWRMLCQLLDLSALTSFS